MKPSVIREGRIYEGTSPFKRELPAEQRLVVSITQEPHRISGKLKSYVEWEPVGPSRARPGYLMTLTAFASWAQREVMDPVEQAEEAVYAEVNPQTIPACLFQDLLTGWQGPVVFGPPHARQDRWPSPATLLSVYRVYDGQVYAVDYSEGDRYDAPIDIVELPLFRIEARHRLCVVLAAPEECEAPNCDAGRVSIENPRGDEYATACPECRGTGFALWSSKTTGWHLLPQSEGGLLPDNLIHHSPVLLACHAQRVNARLGEIAGVLSPWGLEGVRTPIVQRDNYLVELHCGTGRGRGIGRGWHALLRGKESLKKWKKVAGPEFQEAGRFAADKQALLAGYVLLEEDGSIRTPALRGPNG